MRPARATKFGMWGSSLIGERSLRTHCHPLEERLLGGTADIPNHRSLYSNPEGNWMVMLVWRTGMFSCGIQMNWSKKGCRCTSDSKATTEPTREAGTLATR